MRHIQCLVIWKITKSKKRCLQREHARNAMCTWRRHIEACMQVAFLSAFSYESFAALWRWYDSRNCITALSTTIAPYITMSLSSTTFLHARRRSSRYLIKTDYLPKRKEFISKNKVTGFQIDIPWVVDYRDAVRSNPWPLLTHGNAKLWTSMIYVDIKKIVKYIWSCSSILLTRTYI